MTFSYEDLLTINEILADVLVNVNDREYKEFTPGWYKRQTRTALEKLNYHAPFIEQFKDIAMPDNLILPMPKGAWNIKDIFVWNGAECVIESSARVFHKENFLTLGKDMGYTARKKNGQSDYFIPHTQMHNEYTLFYNVNMGNIMFSQMCQNYDNVRIVYNGVPTNIDDVKFIPPFVRDAIVGYVTERAFFALKAKDLAYRTAWMDAKQDLYIPTGREPSRWDNAISKIKQIDKKSFDDMSEYLSKMNY